MQAMFISLKNTLQTFHFGGNLKSRLMPRPAQTFYVRSVLESAHSRLLF
jgi:hypothetical protein